MRILTVGNMYPPHQLGGAEVVWQSWVEHARAEGHDVRVLVSDVRVPGVADVAEPGVARTLRWYWRDHAFPVLGKRERLGLERHNARVLDQELARRPDVVVFWAMAGMSMGLIERVRRRGVPGVAVLGDYWLTYGVDVDGWMRAWSTRPRAARLADRLTGLPTRTHLDQGLRYVFVSETVRAGARTTFPDLPDTEVAHHGPDLGLFREAPRPPWRWELLVAGRLDERKGVDLPLRALTGLPEARLTIAGGGDPAYEEQLRALAVQLGVADRVVWRGKVDRRELPGVMAAADALVFPVTWAEPWGLVPSEAMAVGLPVVGSGRGGSGEYLRDGVNARVFDPDDGPEALARRLRELADDPVLRERLVAGGLATARVLASESFDARVQAAVDRAAAQRQP